MLRLLLALVLLSSLYGQTAAVFAPDQTLNPGQTIATALSFASGGQTIAAIQFDVSWDAPLNLNFTLGDQLRNASKTPYFAAIAPRSVRCLVVGMNQTGIADGELLKFFLSADVSSAPGAARVTLANALAADPYGAPVALASSAMTVQIQAGAAARLLPTAAVLNAASLAPGPISPGEIITVFGLPPLSLRIDGVRAPILFAGSGEINAIVPFGLDLKSTAAVEVELQDRVLTANMPVSTVAPGIFTSNATGVGPGAILNEDYSVNSLDNPAAPGSVVMVYGTGFGPLQSLPTDRQIVDRMNPTTSLVTATIAGLPAEVLYAGAAPGQVAGVIQVNVRIPLAASHNIAASVILSSLGFSTLPGTSVAIQ